MATAAATAGGGGALAQPDEQDLPFRPTAADTGEAASFEQLVRLHDPKVRRLTYRLLGWRSGDVDDVVQDVFLALLKRLGTFRGDASLATWITTVTLNRCRTHRRRQWVRLRWLKSCLNGEQAQSRDENDRMESDDTAAEVRVAVQALKPRDREVIVLFYLEQLPVAEVAALLRLRNNAVEVRLHRARQRLKGMLAHLMESG
jgi:RNA polymerase sigma-70 factor (ECF subfamily)